MKLVNWKAENGIRLGILTDRGIVDVKQAMPDAPADIEQVISGGEECLSRLAELAKKDLPVIPAENAEYAPCVLHPEKILCVGLNYRKHGAECSMEIPETPTLFSKFKSALAAHNESIPLPENAVKFDYEAELVVVIGKKAVNVSKEEALSYVFGYTAGNDLSARELQTRTSQWLLGKSCDHFAPLGPCVVTAEEIDPNNLAIRSEVNGVTRQSSNTREMIFSCADIISYVSKYMTLMPGDIIFTGTPDGVILGYPEEKQVWLKSGDKITVSIEKIGFLTNVLK